MAISILIYKYSLRIKNIKNFFINVLKTKCQTCWSNYVPLIWNFLVLLITWEKLDAQTMMPCGEIIDIEIERVNVFISLMKLIIKHHLL